MPIYEKELQDIFLAYHIFTPSKLMVVLTRFKNLYYQYLLDPKILNLERVFCLATIPKGKALEGRLFFFF